MGVVHRAADRLTGDTVALKQVTLSSNLQVGGSLTPGATQDDLRLALAHEFQILAGLRHPHIISVLDYGFDEERQPFFTMSYLTESQNILDAAQDAPFDHKIELIQQLLHALAYLHRRGVLHRDLKPDNVLVADGVLRVLDFGLSVTEQIKGSDLAGTPLYMPPELFDGESYSSAADLYSAGVLLYQLLTGEHPFAPFDHAFLDRLLDEPPDLHQIDARIRPFLAQLLAKTPEQRFPTAAKALMALAKALDEPLPPETAAIRESYLQAAEFVGREAEMRQLTAALTQAKGGQGSAWLIGGESGVGKSRLVSELKTNALVSGFQVVCGQGVNDGGGSPYQLWQAPLRQLLVSTPTIDAYTASVLHQLVPDIAHLLGQPVRPPPELGAEAAQLRLFGAIANLIALQAQPVLLLLEDLQWADASLLPLPDLVRSIAKQPFLIIGTYRDDERPNLPQLLPNLQPISLERLDDDTMVQLSTAILGEIGCQPEIVAFLQRETEGNAFFAVEVVRALAAEAGRLQYIGQDILPDNLLPQGIRDIVQRRITQVPQWAQSLLQLAAVAGRELDLALLSRLGDGVDVMNKWLPACAETAVFEAIGNQWRFSHDKIREALLADLSPKTSVAHHRRVATGLIALYDNQSDYAAKIAFHWQHAQNSDQERKYAILAGDHAQSQYLYQETLTFYERAYALLRQAETAVALQETIDLSNKLSALIANSDAVRAYEFAVEAKQMADSELATGLHPLGLALALQNMSFALDNQAHHTQAIPLLEQALALFKAMGDEQRQAEALGRLSRFHWCLAQYDLAEWAALKVQRIGEALQDQRLIMSSYVSLAMVCEMQKRPDEEVAYEQQALQIARQIGDRNAEVQILNNHAVTMSNQGNKKERIACALEAIELAKEIGNIRMTIHAQDNLSRYYLDDGDYEKAWGNIKESLVLVEGRGFLELEVSIYLGAAKYFQTQDQFDDALDYLAKANALIAEVEHYSFLKELFEANIEIYTAIGDTEKTTVYEYKLDRLLNG